MQGLMDVDGVVVDPIKWRGTSGEGVDFVKWRKAEGQGGRV